jgi:riboflavin transporter FmnP
MIFTSHHYDRLKDIFLSGDFSIFGGDIMLQSLKDNLGFIGICLLIFAALFVIALLYERLAMKNRRKLSSTHYVTYTAIFSALAGVLMVLEIPLFFAPVFYKIDLSEIPVLICTFYLGPVAGVTCELIKVLVKLMIKGTTTAFVGDFANFAVGCSFVLPASMIYHAKKSRKTALVGMIVGTLVMTIFGSLFNAVYLLPKFAEMYGMPLDALVAMGTQVNASITNVSTLVLFAVVPFNLLKGTIDSALTFLLYKRISPILHKEDAKRAAHLDKTHDAVPEKTKS